MRVVLCVAVIAAGCGSRDPEPPTAPMKLDLDQVSRVTDEALARLDARTTAALVPTAGSARPLGIGVPRELPYSRGRTFSVPITLTPATLRVPTELGLSFQVTRDDAGALAVTAPAREDLVTATRLALAGEDRALAVAAKALDDAGVVRPAPDWQTALRGIRLDPRLPAANLPGDPSWSVFFDPYDEATGGATFVLIDAPTFAVQRVQGGRRR